MMLMMLLLDEHGAFELESTLPSAVNRTPKCDEMMMEVIEAPSEPNEAKISSVTLPLVSVVVEVAPQTLLMRPTDIDLAHRLGLYTAYGNGGATP